MTEQPKCTCKETGHENCPSQTHREPEPHPMTHTEVNHYDTPAPSEPESIEQLDTRVSKDWPGALKRLSDTPAPSEPPQPKCPTCDGRGIVAVGSRPDAFYDEACPECAPAQSEPSPSPEAWQAAWDFICAELEGVDVDRGLLRSNLARALDAFAIVAENRFRKEHSGGDEKERAKRIFARIDKQLGHVGIGVIEQHIAAEIAEAVEAEREMIVSIVMAMNYDNMIELADKIRARGGK